MAEPVPPRVVHVDLARGLPELRGSEGGRGLYAVWWWRELALGHDELAAPGLPPRPLAERIATTIAPAVAERLHLAGLDVGPDAGAPLARLDAVAAAPPPGLSVSVAICTRERPGDLERCLRSVRAARNAPEEIVVVDNGPSAATRAVVAGFPGVAYLAEPRPGLSAARNAAVAATSGELLAFVDDDAEVHPGWLEALRAPFADPEVMVACGLVLPAALETEAQYLFETGLDGLGRGYRPRRFGPGFVAAGRAAPVWEIGAGCNMALRRQALELEGPYDERLGAGTAGCSEDSELWYRVLARGGSCVYEPASVVFHHHRRERAELRRQARAYLRGHVAALFVQFARFGHVGNLRRAFGPLPLHLARVGRREASARGLAALRLAPAAPARPIGAEIAGYVAGMRYLPLAVTPPPPRHKAPLGAFLRSNPFPHPLTEGFFYREKMRAVHRVAPDVAFQRVLEVGGGRSGLARKLFPTAHITNTDLDPAHAEAAMNDDPRITFMTADATALPFADGSFDAVTLLDVLEHIPDDRAAAAEALRVLRPGGWVLVTTPNERWRSPYHAAMRPICPTSEQMIARWQHVRVGYRLSELEALFGGPAAARADFINPITVIGHDLAFSRLRGRLRRAGQVALSPLTWAGYLAQRGPGRGTETAASWRKPGP